MVESSQLAKLNHIHSSLTRFHSGNTGLGESKRAGHFQLSEVRCLSRFHEASKEGPVSRGMLTSHPAQSRHT